LGSTAKLLDTVPWVRRGNRYESERGRANQAGEIRGIRGRAGKGRLKREVLNHGAVLGEVVVDAVAGADHGFLERFPGNADARGKIVAVGLQKGWIGGDGECPEPGGSTAPAGTTGTAAANPGPTCKLQYDLEPRCRGRCTRSADRDSARVLKECANRPGQKSRRSWRENCRKWCRTARMFAEDSQGGSPQNRSRIRHRLRAARCVLRGGKACKDETASAFLAE